MARPDEMSVILFVDRLKIEARLKTSGYRLLDVLNDPMTEYLQIYDARVSERGETVQQELHDAVIVKAEISVAVVPSDRHEAKERRRFIAIDKKRYPAPLFADGFDVRGTIHLGGPSDPVIALAGELQGFFAITEATLTHTATGERLDAPVIMPNKRLLSMIHIGDRVRGEERRAAWAPPALASTA